MYFCIFKSLFKSDNYSKRGIMKKIVTFLSLIVAVAGIAFAQQGSTAKKSYVINEQGVDCLQLNKKFLLKPPAGSIYDRAVKGQTNDFGMVDYTLYKNNKKIGDAYVESGMLSGVMLYECEIQLDNGFKLNGLLKDAFSLGDIDAYMYFDDMEYDYVYPVSYKGVSFGLSEYNLSDSGNKKLQKLKIKQDKWSESGDGSDQPMEKLDAGDFKEGCKVVNFCMGVCHLYW